MTEARTPIDPRTLLEHREWVRTVARSLVSDQNLADDLEQSAWLAAFSSPPRHAQAPKSWLGAVIRNIARNRRRGETRRTRREKAVSRPEGQHRPVAELVAEADLQRRLARAVLGLPERYREVILMRFFDDETAVSVAQRLAVSVETIRTRQKRALSLLRRELHGELGDDWVNRCALVAFGSPAAMPPTHLTPNSGPAEAAGRETLMNAQTLTLSVAASVALLVTIGTWQVLAVEDGPTPTPTNTATAPETNNVADAVPLAPAGDDEAKKDEAKQDEKPAKDSKGDAKKEAETSKTDGDAKKGADTKKPAASSGGNAGGRRIITTGGGGMVLGGGGPKGGGVFAVDMGGVHAMYAKQMGLDELPENAIKALEKAQANNSRYFKAAFGTFDDHKMAAIRNGQRLRKLDLADRWKEAVKSMSLSDSQKTALKAAVKARDSALLKAHTTHEFDGPKGTLMVPSYDGAKAEKAFAAYAKTCNDLLDSEQRKVWKAEGFGRVFGEKLSGNTAVKVQPKRTEKAGK